MEIRFKIQHIMIYVDSASFEYFSLFIDYFQNNDSCRKHHAIRGIKLAYKETTPDLLIFSWS